MKTAAGTLLRFSYRQFVKSKLMVIVNSKPSNSMIQGTMVGANTT